MPDETYVVSISEVGDGQYAHSRCWQLTQIEAGELAEQMTILHGEPISALWPVQDAQEIVNRSVVDGL